MAQNKKDAANASAEKTNRGIDDPDHSLDPGSGLERRTQVQDTWDSQSVHEPADHSWSEPTLLDAPEPRPGFDQMWVRTALYGQPDPGNVARNANMGWKPRPLDTVPTEFSVPSIAHGRFAGFVGVEGMVLMERPKWKSRGYLQAARDAVKRQFTSLKQSLFSATPKNDAFGQVEFKSKVTASARKRPVEIAEDPPEQI
jgi:hypothetical protein